MLPCEADSMIYPDSKFFISFLSFKAEGSPSEPSSLLFVVLAPLSLAVIIFISLYFRIPSRVVSKVWIHIPNPATFFQPLYSEHNGNFQEWIHNNQLTSHHNPSGGSVQELRVVKQPREGDAVVVILNPQVEAVSNISYLKPIPTNHMSPLNPDSDKHNFDLGAMYVKSDHLTESNNSFYSTSVLEYCDGKVSSSISGSGGLLLSEGQHGAESWPLCEDPAYAGLLSTVPQEPDAGYSYSDEYCTLSHSDTSHGLVPAKIGLRLIAANRCQAEKRGVAEDLEGIDGNALSSACPAAEKQQLPQ
ncbi:uncharacterized protein [Heptranchias perlo]|uniref:uncharacterized protein n=1 Tax=Heptranchias perlo TaxID=212740 RepID=UPI003559E5BB